MQADVTSVAVVGEARVGNPRRAADDEKEQAPRKAQNNVRAAGRGALFAYRPAYEHGGLHSDNDKKGIGTG